MIESSLSSYATKVNFLMHNLAQLSSSTSSDQIFTFSDKAVSAEADGKVILQGLCIEYCAEDFSD